ncbi:lipid-binding SYLF domain-containing protein [Pararhodospirillum photometricum]|uniref:lipid-binding SYLF domain-containing protein n=1 Tax=Pararhodospirillum photometricum TaxID=1084 RepID=UPI00031CFF49|nr:lipid-binding SYLF domain-containing protein [Pararhodospirillum photometricum]
MRLVVFSCRLLLGLMLALPGGRAWSQSQGPIPLVGSGGSPAYGQEFGTAPAPASEALPEREVGRAPTPLTPEPAGDGATTSGSFSYSTDTPAAAPRATEAPGTGAPLSSAAQEEAQALMSAAQATIERLTRDSGFQDTLKDLLRRARGVLIVPAFYKAGFFLGAAYGNGVLMARLPDGSLSDPAFYRLTAGSFGFQIGMQSNEIVMVLMTEAGLRAVMEDRFKGGATASATFFLIGGGADASTTTALGQDIYAFSHSVGLFGGAGLEGTAIEPRPVWNEAVYGGGATPAAIVLQGVARTPRAAALRQAVPGFP